MNERTSTGRQTIGSVENAFDIIEYIQKREPVGVTEVSEATGRSKSSTFHYLATLTDRGYLDRVDDGYQLGLRFLTLGGTARERERLFRLGKSDADKLSQDIGEKVRLIVERDGYGITLYQEEGDDVENTYTHVGSTEELYCTAAGKAFLAEIPDDELNKYLSNKKLEPYTEHTITDELDLRSELEQIQTTGVAFDDRERYDDIRCVAAPIKLSDGTLLGTFSVSAPTERMSEHRFRTEIPNKIQNAVTVVEINTTYSEWMQQE
ncbi:IclR family transcriptional regulator [Halomicroarcula sp. GCM10025324]|uniref:IclR family transcriptional regulator n=1 Tax=Haloarcula TaxID=2237 RepID=UPI0023E79CC6|nr:IclR family transcriptional regulator [Halomicroarcula sp. ZS-22-S1]